MRQLLKNAATVFIIALLTGSCKKEQKEPAAPIIPSDKRYLASVTDKDAKTVAKLTYYDDKKIKTVTLGSSEYRYVYDNNGNVSSVFIGTEECRYMYNSSGKIISFTKNGQTVPVTYNSAENAYTFTSFLDKMKVVLDTKGNCTKVIYGNNNPTTANFLLHHVFFYSFDGGMVSAGFDGPPVRTGSYTNIGNFAALSTLADGYTELLVNVTGNLEVNYHNASSMYPQYASLNRISQ